jgi:glycerol dehydrogenase
MNNVVELKVGCGKYIQGNNVLQRIGNILKNFSNRVLIIGGSTTTDIVMDKVETVIKESGLIYEVIRHEGTCSRSSALDYANKAQKEKYGVLMGIGGGKLMDLVKAVSYYSRLPVVNVPTSIATCAAVSAVCIMYTDEGKPDGSISMKKEVDCVVADTNIIATYLIPLSLPVKITKNFY